MVQSSATWQVYRKRGKVELRIVTLGKARRLPKSSGDKLSYAAQVAEVTEHARQRLKLTQVRRDIEVTEKEYDTIRASMG